MLSVVVLNITYMPPVLSVVMLNVVMLSVVVPTPGLFHKLIMAVSNSVA
jgi:hypothetical protein